MLEKFNQLAEQTVTNVSRRCFLERFGRGAMAVAAAAGMLACGKSAKAARRGRKCSIGYYQCPDGSTFEVSFRGGCKRKYNGCELVNCGPDRGC